MLACIFCCKTISRQHQYLVSELQDSTWENTDPFSPDVKFGKVIKVYDGDTITIAAKPYKDYPVYRF